MPDRPLTETEKRALRDLAGRGGSETYSGDVIHELPALPVLVDLAERGYLRFVSARGLDVPDFDDPGETDEIDPELVERVEMTRAGWTAIGEVPPR